MLRDNPVVILSRTDSIGDMVLTLPMAGIIKRQIPGSKVFVLGRTYTKVIVLLSQHVDEFIDYDELEKLDRKGQVEAIKKYSPDFFIHVFPVKKIALLAKRCGVQVRVGTTNRFYHWFSCNSLVRLSRRKSALHESQLNVKLLRDLDIETNLPLHTVPSLYGFTNLPTLDDAWASLIDREKCNVILHPKSKGSAKEWGLDNFERLINSLPPEKFKIFISGTEQDGIQMREFLQKNNKAVDLTGKLSLSQYAAFINQCQALVAASTGPLHIAAALGKKAIGLFSPKRPIHPGRWMPVGRDAHYLVHDEACVKCARGEACECIRQITPQQVIDVLK